MTLRYRPKEKYQIREYKLTDGSLVFVPQYANPSSLTCDWNNIGLSEFQTLEEAKKEIDKRISGYDQQVFIESVVTHEYNQP